MVNSEYRMEVNLKNINDNRIYLSKNITPYYNLVDDLNEKFKRVFERDCDVHISNLDGFNFELMASSLRLA